MIICHSFITLTFWIAKTQKDDYCFHSVLDDSERFPDTVDNDYHSDGYTLKKV